MVDPGVFRGAKGNVSSCTVRGAVAVGWRSLSEEGSVIKLKVGYKKVGDFVVLVVPSVVVKVSCKKTDCVRVLGYKGTGAALYHFMLPFLWCGSYALIGQVFE